MTTRMYHPNLRSVVSFDDSEVARMTAWGWVALAAGQNPPALPNSGGGGGVATGPLPVDNPPADSLHAMTLARLQKFIDWLQMNGANAKGYVSETGWPGSVGPRASEQAQWAALAEQWYRKADAAGLWVTAWGTGSFWGTTYQLSNYYAPGGFGRPVNAARPQAAVLERHLSTTDYLRGINVNGLEVAGENHAHSSGYPFSNANLLTYGTDYLGDDLASFPYYARRGARLARIPFRWERLQPTLGAALNTTELGRLQAVVSAARKVGIEVVIVPLNYAAYWLDNGAGAGIRTPISLPESTTPTAVTAAHFYDLWVRLNFAFRDDPGVHYSLMNEPMDLAPLAGAFTTVASWGTFDATTEGWDDDGGPGTVARVTTGQYEGAGALAITQDWTARNYVNLTRSNPPGVTTSATKIRARIKLPAGATGGSARISVQTDGFTVTTDGPTINLTPGAYTVVEFTPTAAIMAKTINKVMILVVVTGAPAGSPALLLDSVAAGNGAASLPANRAWEIMCQGALGAVRDDGSNKLVGIPTYDVSNVDRVLTNHPSGPWINDPAQNIRYEVHAYLDEFMSGEFSKTYAQDLATAQSRGF